jgi:hypothetical protein
MLTDLVAHLPDIHLEDVDVRWLEHRMSHIMERLGKGFYPNGFMITQDIQLNVYLGQFMRPILERGLLLFR